MLRQRDVARKEPFIGHEWVLTRSALALPPGLARQELKDSAQFAGYTRGSSSAFSLKATPMSDVTRILSEIEQGDPSAAEQLLPMVYEELRKLAAQKMAQESPDHTLQATALVHEAYIRLVDVEKAQKWNSRGHFFAAAAEAMRRIVVESARRKRSDKRGGGWVRQELNGSNITSPEIGDNLVALDDALSQLAETDEVAAKLVELRYFAGLTSRDAAEILGMSSRNADRIWVYARSWLHKRLDT